MQIWKRVLAKSTAVYDALLRERGGRGGGQEVSVPTLESQLIAIAEHGC